MNERPLGGSLRREGLWVSHRDLGRSPLLGREEAMGVVGGQVIRQEQEAGQACASCSRVLVRVEDMYAVCVCCGRPICSKPECQVFCAEETCHQAVCAADRRRIGDGENGQPQYLCLPHYGEWERERIVIGILAVIGISAAVAAAFFWLG